MENEIALHATIMEREKTEWKKENIDDEQIDIMEVGKQWVVIKWYEK